MTGSLLDWNAMDDAIDQEIAQKAKESLSKLDVTPGLQELEEKEQSIARVKELKQAGLTGSSQHSSIHHIGNNATPEQLEAGFAKIHERALASVREMDRYLEEGGRVDVGDKYLLNCKADLNQLVPFKYNWAWSLYLTSCENHWIPSELTIGDDRLAFQEAPLSFKKAVDRCLLAYITSKATFDEGTLLNIYRITTNPECRQYILRQAFESSLKHHAYVDLDEEFGLSNTLYDGYTLEAIQHKDREVRKWRYEEIMKHAGHMQQMSLTTNGTENIQSFVKGLIVLYGYVNWTMQLLPLLNVRKYCDRFNTAGLKRLTDRLTRDFVMHREYITNYINGVVEENDGIMTDAFKVEINKIMKTFLDIEIDLLSNLTIDGEYPYMKSIGTLLTKDFLAGIGILFPVDFTQNAEVESMYEYVMGFKPKVDHEASLSSKGGGLEW